jgi:DNA-binding CsgD family transcriptional regulator
VPSDPVVTALELTGLIYDAVADASRWPIFLEEFVLANRGKQGTLSIGDPQFDEYAVACNYGWSEDTIRLYAERWIKQDTWVEVGRHRVAEGDVAASHELWDEHEMEKTEFYREFCYPRGWHYGMGGTIRRTDTHMSVIGLVRHKEEGPCGERELSLLRKLMPHLRRAALLHGELSSLRSQRRAFADHLDRYPQAFLLTDENGRVMFANAAGQEILKSRDGLKLEGQRLRASSPKESHQLRSAIHELAADPRLPLQRITVTRPSFRSPYCLLVMPAQSSGVIPLGVSQPAVAILVIASETPSATDPTLLKQVFSLTPADARVTTLLVGGLNFEEVSEALNISYETVRTHVRRVLAKTSTTRQGELISLVLRTIPFVRV